MNTQNNQMLELLHRNKGFTSPEKWLDYAITHHFTKTDAHKLLECPDCLTQSSKQIGQFIYYSTLANLKKCTRCGLIFSDTRIDSRVIQTHFEQAYKDEAYFQYRRYRIFDQISRLADSIAPRGGNILDIGGAKGHLLLRLKERRPDLTFVLNDLSKEACNHAASKYSFQTIQGGTTELEQIFYRFNVVILSDVMYYETELRKLLALLPRLVSDNGAIIIRVPNKLPLIRLYQFMRCALLPARNKAMQDNIKFFNPEHLYVFSRRYLLTRLKKLGFPLITTLPSELLLQDQHDLIRPLCYYLSKILAFISFGKIIITPSIIVIARKHAP